MPELDYELIDKVKEIRDILYEDDWGAKGLDELIYDLESNVLPSHEVQIRLFFINSTFKGCSLAERLITDLINSL